MALRVPEQHFDHIKKLLELPDEKISEFLKALAGAGPRFNVYDLATEVSKRAAVPRGLTQGLLVMLGSLYITRDSKAAALETFVDEEFAAALKSSKVLPAKKTQQEWARLRKFLLTALSLDDTLGTSAKAGQVMTDHERIFVDARVLTDVRPIFHLDVSEKPNAAVIIHMLRITQSDKDRNRTSLCFALDSNDIRSLKTLLDRAIQKEETLKKVMESSSLNILGPKAFS
jgi:hypothetical protein